MLCLTIDVDFVLARQQKPVALTAAAAGALDNQRTHAATLGDDVGRRQRFTQFQTFVDVIKHKAAIFFRHFAVRRLNARIRGAHAGAVAHRDGKKQAPVISKESQDFSVRRYLRNDQMDAL